MTTRNLGSLMAAVCAASTLFADSGTWTATTGGNWNDSASWDGGIIASNAGSTAFFNAGTGTVNNDMADPALALLGLQFVGGGYTLAGGAITLDAAGFISVQAGTQTVSTALALQGNTAVNVASAQTLALNGSLSGNGGLTIRGGRVVLGNADNAYLGATVLVTGIVETASVDAFGDSSADPANLVLGDGTFRYTGSSATLSRGLTLAPTNISGNRAIAIDVANAAATLTVAGKVVTPNGSFIKTGEGTLAFTYPGYQEIGKSKPANGESAVITFDANGVAETNGYATFVVDKGRVILGAAGQTNVIVASSGWVGSRTLASPRLDIIGGVTRFINGYFTIGRGTGTTASPQRPSMTLSGGAYVTIEGSGLVMDNSNGQANHRCSPSLGITNATLRVFNDCFLSEDGNATTTVSVANSGLFQNDSATPTRGMMLSASTGAKTDVTFDGGSTGRVYQVRLGRGSTLNVLGGSVFECDTTPTNASLTDLNVGKLLFSGGTLAQRTPKLSSDWFSALPSLWVGANNMTLDVSSYAYVDPQARAEPGNPGNTLTKTGNGTLAMRPTPLNVTVAAGRLALNLESPQATNVNNGAVTLGAGASLEIGANGGAGGMRLNLSGAPLNLSPYSLSSNPDLWRFTQRALPRSDGLIQLTPDLGAVKSQKGGAFLLSRQNVSGPWIASFSYICWSTLADPADGIAFVLHNDPRGTAAIGAHGGSLGYADTTSARITNSVAVGLNATGHQLRFGRQGSFVDTRNLPAALPKLALTPVKTQFTVSYDGAGLLTVLIARPGALTYSYTWAIDIASEVGGSEAYLGFTGGTGDRYGQHSVADVQFYNGTDTGTAYCRYGGRVTLGAAETLTTVAAPAVFQRGFQLGELTFADNAVLNAETTAALVTPPPAPTLEEQGMWKLNGVAHWLQDGRLATSTNAYNQPGGSAFTTNAYPVTGSWTARFGFDLGDATDAPADYVTFVAQSATPTYNSSTPNPGLSIMWRYYVDTVTTTHLRMYTNGVVVQASTNITPVTLRTGGHADMTVAYDAQTRNLTVTTAQSVGTNVTVFADVDLLTAVGSTSAFLGFAGATGGLYAENIISDFSFSSEALSAGGSGYLAFDRLTGSGTLVKRGGAALGLPGDLNRPTSNLTVRLEQGGLVLRKNNLEPLTVKGARTDWVFTQEGKWATDSALQFCQAGVLNSTGTATSFRRVRVKEPWTITYSFLFGKKNGSPADAYSLFFHNDPRGPGAVGGATAGAGYTGITPSFGVRWCFYPGHSAQYSNKVTIGRSGGWDEGKNVSYLPVVLNNGITGNILTYDPTAATLTTVVTQGVFAVTNVFTGVNLPTDVGGDFAYLGFGGGCGGAQAEMRVRDFTMTYGTALADTVADQSYLANVILPVASTNTVTLDTSIPAGAFKIAAANVGDGATFGLAAALQPGTLTIATVTQAGDATYPVSSGSTLALANVTGGATLTKTGSGTLALSGTTATYTGDTLLSAGTLSLPAALLPSATDLYVTSGATLNLAFTGKQYVHSLYVNGALMPGGQYTAAKVAWIIGDGVLVVTYPPVGTLIQVK